jgi:hypothetical protein
MFGEGRPSADQEVGTDMGKHKKPRGTAVSTPAPAASADGKPVELTPGDEGIMTTDAHVEGHGIED